MTEVRRIQGEINTGFDEVSNNLTPLAELPAPVILKFFCMHQNHLENKLKQVAGPHL